MPCTQLSGLVVLRGQVVSDLSVNALLPLIPLTQHVCNHGFLPLHDYSCLFLVCLHPPEQFQEMIDMVLLLPFNLKPQR